MQNKQLFLMLAVNAGPYPLSYHTFGSHITDLNAKFRRIRLMVGFPVWDAVEAHAYPAIARAIDRTLEVELEQK